MAGMAEEETAPVGFYTWNGGERWRLMGLALSLFAVRQRVWGDIRRYRAWREDLDVFLAESSKTRQEWQYYLPVTRAEWQQFKQETAHESMGE